MEKLFSYLNSSGYCAIIKVDALSRFYREKTTQKSNRELHLHWPTAINP